MERFRNDTNRNVKQELPALLNELSASYILINATEQELDDLDESIQELKTLVDFLEDQA